MTSTSYAGMALHRPSTLSLPDWTQHLQESGGQRPAGRGPSRSPDPQHVDKWRHPSKNPAQLKQAHELDGRIALAERDYDKAIAELQQANQQDPRNLYRLSQAYQGKGDGTKATELCTKATEFNSLPQLNHPFILLKAQKMAAGKKA